MAEAAGDDELDLAVEADVLEGRPGLADGGQGRDAGMLLEQLGRGGRAPFHAVDHDHVGARLGGQPDVVEDARGPHLDEDRHVVIGRLAQLLDLDDEVVGAEEVGMTAGGALVDAGGRSRSRATSPETFEPSSNPPVPGLAPWPIVSSMASACRRCCTLIPYRLGRTS